MNPDVTYASCDAPQEKTDKEVELDEDGNEVRKNEQLFSFDVDGVSFLSFFAFHSSEACAPSFASHARAVVVALAHHARTKMRKRREEDAFRLFVFLLCWICR